MSLMTVNRNGYSSDRLIPILGLGTALVEPKTTVERLNGLGLYGPNGESPHARRRLRELGLYGPDEKPLYEIFDVGFAKVIKPLQEYTPNGSITALAEDAHANSIRVYDRHGLGSTASYLEKGLRSKAREFVRGRAKGGRYTRGSVTIPKGERPVFLEPIEPTGYTIGLSMDTSRPRTYQVDISSIDKPGGFYIPHGYGDPREGMSVIDVTRYLPHEEERQVEMIERSLRREAEFYRMLGGLFGINIGIPADLRERVRRQLRRTYFFDELAVGIHETLGHYEQDARGMLNPRIASLLGTVPIYDRNLVETQNVRQTAEVIGGDVGYSRLMPLYDEFARSMGLTPNDLLVLDPETRAKREEQYAQFMKNKMN